MPGGRNDKLGSLPDSRKKLPDSRLEKCFQRALTESEEAGAALHFDMSKVLILIMPSQMEV